MQENMGVCRYGSASVQMSLREVCRYVSSVQPLPLHTTPPQRAGSSVVRKAEYSANFVHLIPSEHGFPSEIDDLYGV